MAQERMQMMQRIQSRATPDEMKEEWTRNEDGNIRSALSGISKETKRKLDNMTPEEREAKISEWENKRKKRRNDPIQKIKRTVGQPLGQPFHKVGTALGKLTNEKLLPSISAMAKPVAVTAAASAGFAAGGPVGGIVAGSLAGAAMSKAPQPQGDKKEPGMVTKVTNEIGGKVGSYLLGSGLKSGM